MKRQNKRNKSRIVPSHPCACADSSPGSCTVFSKEAWQSRCRTKMLAGPEAMGLVSSQRLGSAVIFSLCYSCTSAPKHTPETGHFLATVLFNLILHFPPVASDTGDIISFFFSYLSFFPFGFTPLLCAVWDGESLYIIYGRPYLLKKGGENGEVNDLVQQLNQPKHISQKITLAVV